MRGFFALLVSTVLFPGELFETINRKRARTAKATASFALAQDGLVCLRRHERRLRPPKQLMSAGGFLDNPADQGNHRDKEEDHY